MSDDTNDPDRPRRIAEKAKEISTFFGERQSYYAARAQDYGYSKDIFQTLSLSFEHVPDDPAFSGTEQSLGKFYNLMRAREAQSDTYRYDVSSASYALASTVSSTASVVPLRDMQDWLRKVQPQSPPPHWSKDRVDFYAKRLEALNPELGKLERSVWQTYYGGADSADRTSLFVMRQLYDHFFAILAPDEDVRKSPFFKEKNGNQPLQIHRKERLQYAASFRVPDRALGDLLLSEAYQILEIYERLNKLHSRAALDPSDVRNVLVSMQAVIELWVDAADL